MITYKGQSAESSLPASSIKRVGTLDFRFADEEDALEIETIVSAGSVRSLIRMTLFTIGETQMLITRRILKRIVQLKQAMDRPRNSNSRRGRGCLCEIGHGQDYDGGI